MIEYDSNTEELEMMMAVMGGGSNPEEGGGALPSVMGKLESRVMG